MTDGSSSHDSLSRVPFVESAEETEEELEEWMMMLGDEFEVRQHQHWIEEQAEEAQAHVEALKALSIPARHRWSHWFSSDLRRRFGLAQQEEGRFLI